MTAVSPKLSEPRRGEIPLLYPILDIDLCRMRGLDPADVARAFISGGARLIQVRQKSGGGNPFLSAVRAAVAEGEGTRSLIIVTDRADIAAMAGAAGVHVGQADLPVDAVRSIAGASAVIGLSTHTTAQVDEALASTADYVAVGPVFRTSTKETGYEPRGLELVRYAANRGKPVIAIGGITLVNAPQVLEAGASAVAVISDLLAENSPEARVRAFLAGLPPQPFHV